MLAFPVFIQLGDTDFDLQAWVSGWVLFCGYRNLHLEHRINRKPMKFMDEYLGIFKKEKKNKEKKNKNVVFFWAGQGSHLWPFVAPVRL